MPWLGRKASSLLVVLLMAILTVSAVGIPAAAQEGYAGVDRIVTITPEESECDAGNCAWDMPRIVVRPGDRVTLIAEMTQAASPHNLKIGTAKEGPGFPVTYEPANRDGSETQTAAGIVVYANFTVPADFTDEIPFICTLHQPSMSGVMLSPAAFAASGGGGGAGEPIHHLGVHYLAYWVGVIAFAILFVVYGVTFFLFKYNETSATTDHKDRSGGAAGKVSGGNATLLAIVIGGAILAGVIYLAQG